MKLRDCCRQGRTARGSNRQGGRSDTSKAARPLNRAWEDGDGRGYERAGQRHHSPSTFRRPSAIDCSSGIRNRSRPQRIVRATTAYQWIASSIGTPIARGGKRARWYVATAFSVPPPISAIAQRGDNANNDEPERYPGQRQEFAHCAFPPCVGVSAAAILPSALLTRRWVILEAIARSSDLSAIRRQRNMGKRRGLRYPHMTSSVGRQLRQWQNGGSTHAF